MIPKSTSSIAINTFPIILKVIVSNLLRSTYKSCTITPTINYFVFINTIIHMTRRTKYRQQYTMVTWVMRVIVASLVSISASPITNRIFSYVAREKVAGLFRPRSMSVIITSYISPLVAIIVISIYPPISIIKTDVTLFFL